MMIDQIVKTLRAFIRENPGWSVARLAQEAGLRASTLSKFWDQDWNPQLSTLQALERVVQNHQQGDAA